MISFNILKKDIQNINKCLICSSKSKVVLSNIFLKNNFIIFQTSYCKKCLYIYRSKRPKINWLEKAWEKREKIQKIKKIKYINKKIEVKGSKDTKNYLSFYQKK